MAGKKKPKFLVFPSDLGKNYYQVRKKKLALSGEVETYNMYEQLDQIKSYQEIMTMSQEEGHRYIMAIKAKHNVKSLQKYWGMGSYHVYNKMFKKFGIPVDSTKGRRSTEEVKINADAGNIMDKIRSGMVTPSIDIPIIIVEPDESESVKQESTSTFTIKVNGNFSGKETSDRIVNILSILNVDNEYNMSLKMMDIDLGSKLKSNTEHNGIAIGKEIQDQLQNLNLLQNNMYKVVFTIEEL